MESQLPLYATHSSLVSSIWFPTVVKQIVVESELTSPVSLCVRVYVLVRVPNHPDLDESTPEARRLSMSRDSMTIDILSCA